LYLSLLSHIITAGGIIITTKKKLMGINVPANTPKALIGMIGLIRFAKKAAAVVAEVTVIALTPLLKEYAILYFLSAPTISFDCLQASTNTKISSAAIPQTRKTAITYK
jgi:hypothetical protein